jgi:hypothetical protein
MRSKPLAKLLLVLAGLLLVRGSRRAYHPATDRNDQGPGARRCSGPVAGWAVVRYSVGV